MRTVTTALDPIGLEVLRSRLEAVAEQASLAIEHTAVSPAVTESKDYSVTLMDADGRLVVGAGTVLYHFAAASHSVRATIARHGDTIRDGDVFIANDPHNGGGLHPQDVMVQRPVFAQGQRIGWVGVSAHMMDMGGMVVGSFAPAATECYQEALRVPAVRLFREGVEVTEVWDIFRTNVRMARLVEMDLRGLVAGAHFATERLAALVDSVGVGDFEVGLRVIRDLTEAEMRRRISEIADGTYRWTSWTEFDEEFSEIPCTLTVDGDQLWFDFAGAAAQTEHFFNSKPYIIASELGVMLWLLMASDLPFNDGVLAVFDVMCPEGTIVNATPPAPIGAAHMHVGLNAATVALSALGLALAASPDAPARAYVSAPGGDSALGNQVWSWALPDGTADAFIPFDGNWVGAPASEGVTGSISGSSPAACAATGASSTSRCSRRGSRCWCWSDVPAEGRSVPGGTGPARATTSRSGPTGSLPCTGRCSGCGAGSRSRGSPGGAPGRLRRWPSPAPTARPRCSPCTRRACESTPATTTRSGCRAPAASVIRSTATPPAWRPTWSTVGSTRTTRRRCTA